MFYLDPIVLCDPDILDIFINVTVLTLQSRDHGLIMQFLETNPFTAFYESDLLKIFYPLELEDYIYILKAFRKFYIEKKINFFDSSLDCDVFDYFFRLIFKTIGEMKLIRKRHLYKGIKKFVKNKSPEFSQYIMK